jgi:polyisoprenoid-binding protein YceI
MKQIGLLILCLSLGHNGFAKAVTFSGNAKDTKVSWAATKVTGKHNGTVQLKKAELQVEGDKIISGSVDVDLNQIVCLDITDKESNSKLVGHLKSDDFFSVEKFPVSNLIIKKVKYDSKNTGNAVAEGDLVIKGNTAPISFPLTSKIENGKLVATAKIVIDRTKYGIRYGSGKFFQNLGDKVIHDNFEITVDLVAQK